MSTNNLTFFQGSDLNNLTNEQKVGGGLYLTTNDNVNRLSYCSEDGAFPIEIGGLIKGEGVNSIVQSGQGSVAQGEGCIALGKNNASNLRGYYFKHIDFENKKIYLCQTNDQYTETKPTDETNYIENINPLDAGWSNAILDEETEEYIRDKFSLIAGNHFMLCGEIETIESGIITYYNKLKWNGTELTEDIFNEKIALVLESSTKGIDDFSITVLGKPTIGDHIISAYGFTQGSENSAAGWASVEGYGNHAIGQCSHAEGQGTVAGYNCHAEGNSTTSVGQYSHAEGYHSISNGMGSHAQNGYTKSSGNWSHSEGFHSSTNGSYSHSEGYYSVTGQSAQAAHAEGYETTVLAEYAHVEGKATSIALNASGAHAEGGSTTIEKGAFYAHVEGYKGIIHENAIGAHVEGHASRAYGKYSHAQGYKAIAYGDYSSAEGQSGDTTVEKTDLELTGDDLVSVWTSKKFLCAKGKGSHAQGFACLASGDYSYAQGFRTRASYNYSYSVGGFTYTSAAYQTVVGKYNTDDSSAFFIVGAGTSDSNRFNAFSTGKSSGEAFIRVGNTMVTESQLLTMKDAGGFVAQSSEPSNTNLLWIDTNDNGGLKYYDGSAWVSVPVRFS